MPFAVLQTNLETPSVAQLQRAARSVPGLTAIDASILGGDAFGVLVKNFSEQQAAALQGALRGEGVETEIVDQSFLPELPNAKLVHRLECRPEHLLVYDPLGRTFPVPWAHVMIVAAGIVRVTEFVRERTDTFVTRGAGEYRLLPVTHYNTSEQQNFRGLAELILTGSVIRFSVNAEKFNFSYLGARQTADPMRNFMLLVQDALQFSTQAGRNRGADSIRIDPGQPFVYPSKNAFHEEIVWMLWQMKKSL